MQDAIDKRFGTRTNGTNEKWEPSPYSVRAFTATPPIAEEKQIL